MRTSKVAGLVFANANDNLLKRLTEKRSMASVPFGGRYRLIDFCLSNLVNAGVTNVGIMTTGNYRSLMDHVGSGIYWDLDRKNGGLHILAPYMSNDVRRFKGTIDALDAASDYIKRCGSEYMVLCAADILANVDISAVMKAHIANDADVTVVYHKGILPPNREDAMILSFDDSLRVESISFDAHPGEELNYGIGITVISRELLSKLVADAVENEDKSFNRHVLAKKTSELKIIGFEHSEFVTLMNGTDTYYKANMALLDREVRKQLFNPKRPIYTKTRDEMPTRYGIDADVSNCVIGEGCVIEGTIKNSVLFRGVKVEKGAVVENCILMQETVVSKGAQIDNVIADKNAVIGEEMILKATAENHFFARKNEII